MVSRRLPRPALLLIVLVALAVLVAGVTVLMSVRRATPSGPDPAGAAHPAGAWVGSWATAPVRADRLGCVDCTIRSLVHVSIGGSALRVRLANTFGRSALLVARTTVALPAAADSMATTPGSLRSVTFGGQQQVQVPAGGTVWSDPAPLHLPDRADLLVSTYLPAAAQPVNHHPSAHRTSFVAHHGDRAAEPGAMAFDTAVDGWYVLSGVDVRTHAATGAVVAFGDSITAGSNSSVTVNHRWPDLLAARLQGAAGQPRYGVLNAGIAGNQLLADSRNGPAGLHRLDRDALGQTGVHTAVVLEGINDILFHPDMSATRLIDGYRTLIARLHAHSVRVVGATLTPFGGSGHWSTHGERVRQRVNSWVRGSGAFDDVIDFDAALRDPAAPRRLAHAYDSGDHLHPGDRGYQAMADAVDPGQLGDGPGRVVAGPTV